MTKADEIKIIDKLGESNSYFNNQFSASDIAIMKENIRNDYSLLCGTAIDVELNDLRAKAVIVRQDKQTIANLEVELGAKTASLFNLMKRCVQYAEGIAYDFFPIQTIVKYKLDNNIELNDIDKDFLKTKL